MAAVKALATAALVFDTSMSVRADIVPRVSVVKAVQPFRLSEARLAAIPVTSMPATLALLL